MPSSSGGSSNNDTAPSSSSSPPALVKPAPVACCGVGKNLHVLEKIDAAAGSHLPKDATVVNHHHPADDVHSQHHHPPPPYGPPPDEPLKVLPEDLIFRITGFLDAPSLLQLRCVNRAYYRLASQNEAGWDYLCEVLWRDKIHVAPEARQRTRRGNQKNDGNNNNNNTNRNHTGTDEHHDEFGRTSSMIAYQVSLQDATSRQFITRPELVFDLETETGTIWSFRFKESAGAEWTSVDPWFQGRPCRKMVFLPNGTVKQYIDPSQLTLPMEKPSSLEANNNDDRRGGAAVATGSSAPEAAAALPHNPLALGGTNNSHFVDAEVVFAAEVNEINHHGNNHNNNNNSWFRLQGRLDRSGDLPIPSLSNVRRLRNGARLVDPPTPITWRFSTRPMDLPPRPFGSYIRFSVGGRDVPTYAVRRSPTGNWGFVLESCWGLYASFELPPRVRNASRRRRRLRRTEEGGPLWIDAADSDEESENDDHYTEHDLSELGWRVGHGYNTRANARVGGGASPASLALLLQDDSALPITSDLQWREAFLYNVGARVLPEGDHATEEFDRAWETM